MPPALPLLVLISAPSGGGKTTVCRSLVERDPRLSRVVTCTTRPPRAGEVEGIDYHFLTPECFARRVTAGEFLEHASVYGQSYGTLRAEVASRLEAGRDVLLNIDVQGAASVRAQAGRDEVLRRSLVGIFLLPPSVGELERRLRGRGTEEEAAVRRRLAQARVEIEAWPGFEYVVVSATMSEDVRRVEAILEAERLRAGRVAVPDFSA